MEFEFDLGAFADPGKEVSIPLPPGIDGADTPPSGQAKPGTTTKSTAAQDAVDAMILETDDLFSPSQPAFSRSPSGATPPGSNQGGPEGSRTAGSKRERSPPAQPAEQSGQHGSERGTGSSLDSYGDPGLPPPPPRTGRPRSGARASDRPARRVSREKMKGNADAESTRSDRSDGGRRTAGRNVARRASGDARTRRGSQPHRDGTGGSAGEGHLQRLDMWRRKRDEKVRQQKEELERQRQEDGECTFRPRLSKKAIESKRKTQGTSVVSRLYEWQRRREQHLEAQAREAKRAEFDGCTFRPRIDDTAQAAPSRLDPEIRRALHRPDYNGSTDLNTLKQSGTKRARKARRRVERNLRDLQQDGIEKFLERQEHGRAQRQLRNTVPHATGDGYTGAPTSVKEFRLSCHSDARLAREASVQSPPSGDAFQGPPSPPVGLSDARRVGYEQGTVGGSTRGGGSEGYPGAGYDEWHGGSGGLGSAGGQGPVAMVGGSNRGSVPGGSVRGSVAAPRAIAGAMVVSPGSETGEGAVPRRRAPASGVPPPHGIPGTSATSAIGSSALTPAQQHAAGTRPPASSQSHHQYSHAGREHKVLVGAAWSTYSAEVSGLLRMGGERTLSDEDEDEDEEDEGEQGEGKEGEAAGGTDLLGMVGASHGGAAPAQRISPDLTSLLQAPAAELVAKPPSANASPSALRRPAGAYLASTAASRRRQEVSRGSSGRGAGGNGLPTSDDHRRGMGGSRGEGQGDGYGDSRVPSGPAPSGVPYDDTKGGGPQMEEVHLHRHAMQHPQRPQQQQPQPQPQPQPSAGQYASPPMDAGSSIRGEQSTAPPHRAEPAESVATFVFSPRAPASFAPGQRTALVRPPAAVGITGGPSHSSLSPEAAGDASTAALRAQYVELRAQLEAERRRQAEAGRRLGLGGDGSGSVGAKPEGPGQGVGLAERGAAEGGAAVATESLLQSHMAGQAQRVSGIRRQSTLRHAERMSQASAIKQLQGMDRFSPENRAKQVLRGAVASAASPGT